jgi:heterodisulfide reductase subunit C
MREELGLDPLPPTVHSYPKAVKEIQHIIKKTGFDKLVNYKESKKDGET